MIASSTIKTDDSSCEKAKKEAQLRQDAYIFNLTETTKEAEINQDNSASQYWSRQYTVNIIIRKTSKPLIRKKNAIFSQPAMFDWFSGIEATSHPRKAKRWEGVRKQ